MSKSNPRRQYLTGLLAAIGLGMATGDVGPAAQPGSSRGRLDSKTRLAKRKKRKSQKQARRRGRR